MKVLISALAIFSILVLQSCQKELTADTGNTNPPTGITDSSYLSKIYYVEVNGALTDTGNRLTYSYDNLKRVTAIRGIPNNLYDVIQISYDYYYNGSDTLPFRSRRIYVSANDPAQTQFRYDTTIAWHYYDNTGRNIKDSMINSVADASTPVPYYSVLELRTYSYGSGKIYGFRTYTGINVPNPSYVYPDQKDTALLDALGNITNSKSYRYNSSSTLYELEVVSDFTYDAKQSPFSKLSNFKTFGIFPNGETFYSELPQNTNRVTQNELHSFSGGGGGIHYDYSYTNSYNTNGLIKQALIYDQPPNPTIYAKLLFSYIHL